MIEGMRTGLLIVVLGLWAGGCDEERAPVPCPLGCPDAGPGCETMYEPPPTPGDVDGDGIPNDDDDDADGDGVDNEFEHFGGLVCAGPDEDGDGLANWLDRDSDGDGLLDGTEYEGESSPYDPDSDDDGASDLIEKAAQTVPSDPESTISPTDTIVVGDFGAPAQSFTIRIVNRVENADIFFLVDTTGSMRGERTNLILGISEVIVPMLAEAFEDVAFGAAGFDDYPVEGFGGADDLPFYLLTPMVNGLTDTQSTNASTSADSCPPTGIGELSPGPNEVPDIEDALQGLACHSGSDGPESFVPALWATATGEALPWMGGMVPAQTECPPETIGYPCFRSDAVPIVILIGDAEFHNGPMDAEPYSFDAPTYLEAVDALNEIGANVVSIYSGPDDPDTLGHYLALSRDTGTLSAAGEELVFPIEGDGTGIDSTIVEAIETLAEAITQDVTIDFVDGDEDPSDATSLVTAWRAVEGYAEDGTPGPNPGVSYESKDDTTFVQVVPNAEVEFEVTIENTTISPMEEAIVAVIEVNAIGQGGSVFASLRFFVVVAEDATTLVGL